jgi:SAM-dependent methyltransferase
LERLAELEEWHFWFLARKDLVRRLIERHLHQQRGFVVDVGCGTGSMLAELSRDGRQVMGVDSLREGLRRLQPGLPSALLAQADATHLPLPAGSAELVLLLDVLEHVPDHRALEEVRRVLRPGGKVIIAVPAFAGLWSYRDEAAGHYRRYSREQLFALARGAGLEVCEVQHFQFLLLPILALTRWLGRRGPWWRDFEERRIPLLSDFLVLISRLEVRLGAFVSWPAGSSILAVLAQSR